MKTIIQVEQEPQLNVSVEESTENILVNVFQSPDINIEVSGIVYGDSTIDLSNYWTKTESDSKYKPIGYIPTWNSITGKPIFFSGNYNDLINKPTLFNGTWASLSGTPTTIEGYGITNAFDGDYNSLSNKPTSFTPSTHTHEISDINNLQGSLENKLNKPTSDGTYLVKKIGSVVSYETFSSVDLSNYYTKSETFSQTEINNLLNNKQNNLGYTPENVANKSDSYTASSSTTYASTKALVDGLATKQDRLQDITGNVGVGKTDDTATEKLDVNGNVKAIDFKGQSIKFNLQTSISPTPNTLVPKTDGSRPLWIDNNSIQHEVTLKDDVQDNLICEVTFNSRKELYFSTFDYATGRGVTTIPHGLTIGQTILCAVVPNSFKFLRNNHALYPTLYTDMRNIPYEFYQNMLKAYVVDANTIEIRNWSGATIIVNTTSSQNNGYMLTSNFTWHIELKQGGSIITPNFPINIKNCRIDMLAMGDMDFSGSDYRYINFNLYNNTNTPFTPTNIGQYLTAGIYAGLLNNWIWDKLSAGFSIIQSIYARSIIDIHADTNLATVSIREKRYGRGTSTFALSEVKFDNIVDIPLPNNNGIASLSFMYGADCRYANGTTIRVYKK